jgi:hypothetical protein
MDYNKSDMKFIKTSDKETADKLRTLGFTEITEPNSSTFCFINESHRLTFDVEEYNAVYTNILCL